MGQEDLLQIALETFKTSDALLQIVAFALCNILSVTCSTVAGIGSAIVLIICMELAHSAVASVDSRLMAFFTAMQIQDSIISPINALAFRKHVHMPMILVTAVMWISAEMLGMEVMVHTDTLLIKQFLGWCLVLFMILNHGLPWLRSLTAREPNSREQASRSSKAIRPNSFGKLATQSQKEHHGIKGSAEGSVDEESVLPDNVNIDDEDYFVETVKSCNTEAEIVEGTDKEDSYPKGVSADEGVDFRLSSCREWALVCVLGLGGGFMRGLCGAPLLGLAMFVMLSGIKKEQWRGTLPTLNLFTYPPRLYYYFVVKSKLDPTMAPQMTGSVIGCLLGLPLGHYLGSRVDQATFRKVVNRVVLIGAVLLVTSGLHASLTLGAVTTVGLIIVEIAQYLLRKSRPAMPSIEEADVS